MAKFPAIPDASKAPSLVSNMTNINLDEYSNTRGPFSACQLCQLHWVQNHNNGVSEAVRYASQVFVSHEAAIGFGNEAMECKLANVRCKVWLPEQSDTLIDQPTLNDAAISIFTQEKFLRYSQVTQGWRGVQGQGPSKSAKISDTSGNQKSTPAFIQIGVPKNFSLSGGASLGQNSECVDDILCIWNTGIYQFVACDVFASHPHPDYFATMLLAEILSGRRTLYDAVRGPGDTEFHSAYAYGLTAFIGSIRCIRTTQVGDVFYRILNTLATKSGMEEICSEFNIETARAAVAYRWVADCATADGFKQKALRSSLQDLSRLNNIKSILSIYTVKAAVTLSEYLDGTM
ncbi:hypothetical protein BSLG_006053 [Batrachochytrium salamandrivorans]|nr:hypothetical protein BSLG_006053 [Batrachochytrium salamandrivorans]